jgi:VCBS repeat-containing protein
MNEQHPTAQRRDRARGPASRLLAALTGTVMLLGTVIAQAAPPVFISSPGNQTMLEDGVRVVTAEVSDADGDPITLSAVSGNTTIIPNANVVVNPASGGNGVRNITITPAPNQNGGPVQITLTAVANGEVIQALFTVTVTSVNDVPVTTVESYSPVEDTPFTSPDSVLDNDSDFQGGAPGENNLPLTAVLDAGPSNAASFTLNPNGTFSYTPALNFNGADSFSYRAQDSLGGLSAPTTVTLNVAAVNDAPVAVDDAYSVNEDEVLNVVAPGVLANDSDPVEGSPISASLVSGVTNGALTLNADGSFTYTPAANFFGTDSFTYVANDGTDDSNVATVTITVNSVNDLPVAVDDNATVLEDSGATSIDVLANDTDVEDVPAGLTVTNVTQPANGTTAIVGNAVTYTPDANFNGADQFDYVVTDSDGATDTATVFVTVTAVNDAPSFTIGGPQTVAEDSGAQSVLAFYQNESAGPADEAGQVLTLSVGNDNNSLFAVQPAINQGTGELTYTPALNAFGSALVSVTLSDNGGIANGGDDSTELTFTINVTAVNDPPDGVNDNYTVLEDSGATNLDVLANDTDVENDPLIVFSVDNPANGTAVIVGGGASVEYTPDANFFGVDAFLYTVRDPNGDSDTVLITVTVDPVNDAPTFTLAGNQAVLEDSGVATVPNFLTALSVGPANESGQTPSISVSNDTNALFAVQPAINGAGELTYTPAANAYGVAIVEVTVGDDGGTANGGDDSTTELFSITVTAVNDEPSFTAVNPPASDEDAGAQTVPGWATFNPGPLESDGVLGYTVNNLSNGALFAVPPAVSTDGTLTYTAAADAFGSSTFDVFVQDDGGIANGGDDTSPTLTFTITVNSVNDVPVAGDDSYSVDEDNVLTVIAPGVLGNDSDPVEGSGLTAILDTDVSNGTLTLNGDGSFSYTPDANFFGMDSFTYFANDGDDNSSAATVTIAVNAINDEPSFTAVNPPASDEDAGAQTVPGWATFNPGPLESDGVLGYTVNNLSNGALFAVPPAVSTDGTLTYTAAADAFGSSTFDVFVQDDGGIANGGDDTSPTLTFTITVNSVNDVPVAGDDSYSVDEDNVLTVIAPGVLGNDSDPVEGSGLTAILDTDVSNGTLTLNGDGSFSYTPDANFFGMDSFTYFANDGDDNSSAATVTIAVNAINDEPSFTAVNPPASDEDAGAQTVSGWATFNPGPLESDGVLGYTVNNLSNGALFAVPPAVSTDGTLTYTAAADAFGSSTFDVFVQDDGGIANGGDDTSPTLTFTITVNSVNDVPVAGDDSYSVDEDNVLTVIAPGVLGNDSDPVEGSGLTAILDTDVSNGTLTLNGDGSFSYTPDANFFGMDSFTYFANDGDDNSSAATVTIAVNAINDEPSFTAVNPPASDEDAGAQTVSGWATFNPGPLESDGVLGYTVNNLSNGALFAVPPAVSTDGTLTYTAAADAFGSSTFDVFVQDDGGIANGGDDTSPTLTFTITVNSVNDVPVAGDDSYSVDEDNVLTVIAPGVLGNDSDPVEGSGLTAILDTDVSNGTLTLNGDGSFSYTPDADYFGTDSFTYFANDGDDNSPAATVTITVNPINDAPRFEIVPANIPALIEDASITGPEALEIRVVDPEGDPLTVTATSGNQYLLPNANLGVGGTGNDRTISLFLAPDKNSVTAVADSQSPSVTITIIAFDNQGNSTPAEFQILSVTAVNDAPTFTAGPAQNILEDAGPQSVAWASNYRPGPNTATDESGQTVVQYTVTPVGTPTLTFSAAPAVSNAGVLTYTTALNSFGSATFEVRVVDSGSGVAPNVNTSTPRTLVINAAAVNDAPVANDAAFVTDEDVAVATTLTASDVENDPLTWTIVAGPANGTLSGTAPNLTYTPNANYFGADSFTFRVNDGALDSNVATISLTVNSVNDAPVANDGAATTAEDTPVAATLSATDVENDPLTWTIVAGPTNGTLSGTAPNLTYTPNADFNGSDSFTFSVNDGQIDSNVATFSLTVTPVNDAPVASDGAATTAEDTAVATTLVANDVDGDMLTWTIVAGPTNGTLSGTAPNLTYTPNADYFGGDSFTFQVNDGTVDSNVATFSLTVTPVNDAPVANDGAATTAEDTPVAATLSATDVENDPLTWTIVAGPANGTLSGTAPNLTYTPNADFNGADSFTFRVNDGALDSNVATFSLTVTPVNDAPVASDGAATTAEDTPVATTLVATDVDGDLLTWTIVAGPTNGTLSGTAPNLTYTPNADYFGNDSFTFQVNDGTVDSNVATFSLTVTAVNDAPVANDGTATTAEDTPVATTLTATDVENDPLTWTIVAGPTNGTLSGTAPNLTYTPNADFNGADSFTFRANDGTVDSNVATFSITVTAVNDAPVANDGSATSLEDGSIAVTLVATDADSDPLTWTIETNPANGSLSGTAPNLTYTPNANYFGADSFTFKVNDGTVDSNTATVSLTVTPVNDAPSFTVGPDQNPAAGQTGVVTVPGFITNISAGPANEAGQQVSFITTVNDPAGAVSGPVTIAGNGDLSYTLTGIGGVVNVTVRAMDDGGTANGGVDTSAPQTFSISAQFGSVDLSIVKSGFYFGTNGINWTLTVNNAGPGIANGARVVDNLPASVTGATWDCVGTNGGVCNAASGSGSIDTTVNLPNGGGVVITITATLVNPTASTVINSATVEAPAGITDPNLANNGSTLDLQVALFSDGFEGNGTPFAKLSPSSSVSTVEVAGALVEDAARGTLPSNVASYKAGNSHLVLQSRELNGLVSVRLLQKDDMGLWSSTRWIELWPGDAVRIDFSSSNGQLKTRMAVGPQQ